MADWKPWPKQSLALKTKAFEILFGGARGPGKTDAGLVWMLKAVQHPRFRGLVIRRNADDLKDWVSRARVMYSGCGAEFVGNPPEIRFPTGSTIILGHLKDDQAYQKYQGHEYQRLLIEELTQIPSEENYLMLVSSCRSTVREIDPRVFCTSNPLGPGHNWVKKRFVDVQAPYEKYVDPVTKRTRVYIPGTIDDNPTLIESDPEYVTFLEGLPEDLKKAWRYGSWDVFAGMYFDNFDRNHHIYNPSDIRIEPSWPRFRSIDWGYAAPMACYWHAVGPDNHIYTYKEYYETEKLDVVAVEEILERTGDDDVSYTIGDPQSFAVRVQYKSQNHLEAIPRHVLWAKHGLPMTLGNSDRITGWSRMREYLRVRPYMEGESSWWHISSQCVNLINELGTAMRDKRKPEDVSGDSVDHALEACRLGLMSRPQMWQAPTKKLTDYQAAEAYHERMKEDEGRAIR